MVCFKLHSGKKLELFVTIILMKFQDLLLVENYMEMTLLWYKFKVVHNVLMMIFG